MKFSSICFLLAMFLAASLTTLGQTSNDDNSLQGTLQRLSTDAAKSYVSPIVSGFGADLNGGWFHKAPRSTKLGFDLEVGVVAMGTFFKDENKTFSSSGSAMLDPMIVDQMTQGLSTFGGFRDSVRNQLYGSGISVNIYGPTVVGSKNDSVKLEYTGTPVTIHNFDGAGHDTTLTLAHALQATPVTGLLEELSVLPLAAPQVTLGTIFGTHVSIRYLPEVQLDSKIGSLKYFGFGIQHNPAVWFDQDFPVDLSIGYFTQSLDVGSLLSTSTKAFGLQASRRLGWSYLNLTPYIGYQSESSTMTFTYDYTVTTAAGPSTQHVSFGMDGANSSRFTAGLAIRLLIFNLNADYNFGTYNSATAGLMISL